MFIWPDNSRYVGFFAKGKKDGEGAAALQGLLLCHSRAEPSRAEPSRAEPSRAEPSRAEPSRAGCIASRSYSLARRFGSRILPHLRRDWAHPSHICAGTGRAGTYITKDGRSFTASWQNDRLHTSEKLASGTEAAMATAHAQMDRPGTGTRSPSPVKQLGRSVPAR
jgi:hypothetical protein